MRVRARGNDEISTYSPSSIVFFQVVVDIE